MPMEGPSRKLICSAVDSMRVEKLRNFSRADSLYNLISYKGTSPAVVTVYRLRVLASYPIRLQRCVRKDRDQLNVEKDCECCSAHRQR